MGPVSTPARPPIIQSMPLTKSAMMAMAIGKTTQTPSAQVGSGTRNGRGASGSFTRRMMAVR